MSVSRIAESLRRLESWISRNDWKAYDPFDGLSASRLGVKNVENHYLRIAIQQTVRRFPFNLRPILGIEPQTSSKGMGFCALGYLHMYLTTGDMQYRSKMEHCFDWLMQNYCTDFTGRSWGNHFNYESRGGTIPADVPTIVWTSLIGNVFLDAFEEIGEPGYLEIAVQVSKFILDEISHYDDADGSSCFVYIPTKKENLFDHCVHNSNALGGCLLARVFKFTNEPRLLDAARKSIAYTARRQLQDGAWYYGEPDKFHWIDSFHTGYVLESLHGYREATSDMSFDEVLVKGYRYFRDNFFERNGTPRYYARKTYPIDIQCASQGIQTLVNLRQYADSSVDLAQKVANWTIDHMQHRDGYFYFRKYPLIVNKTPMFHWGQATMLAALSALLRTLRA